MSSDRNVVGSSRLAREIEHHSRIAESAESIWDWASPAGKRRAARRASLLAEATGLGPGVCALELGCGTGLFSEKAAAFGGLVLGFDLSAELLTKARERLAGLSNLRFLRGNAEALPFPEGRFDAVYGSSILHHLDLEKTLREVRRVLRPGGRMAFAEPNLLNPQILATFHLQPLRTRLGLSPDEMAFTSNRARKALEAAGFSDVQVRPFDFLHPSVPSWAIDVVSRLGEGLERLPLVRWIAGSQLLTGRKP